MKSVIATSNPWLKAAGAILLFGCLVFTLRAERAEEPKAAESDQPAESLPSVFVDDHKQGVDPFFPKSTRRVPKVTKRAQPKVEKPDYLSMLKLKGIMGKGDRRIALINSATFAQGEKKRLKLGTQSPQIRCLEIRKDSILVEIEGEKEPKELRVGSPRQTHTKSKTIIHGRQK